MEASVVVKHFINHHGVVLRIVGHGNKDIVVMASGHGDIARWDASTALGTVGSGIRLPWPEWTERVMELAHEIRRA